MAAKSNPRLDDYVSKKQLGFLVSLAALIASHYLGWPDALTEKIVNLVLAYLGIQGLVDLALVGKGSKVR
jgi:hypothetical protein